MKLVFSNEERHFASQLISFIEKHCKEDIPPTNVLRLTPEKDSPVYLFEINGGWTGAEHNEYSIDWV